MLFIKNMFSNGVVVNFGNNKMYRSKYVPPPNQPYSIQVC